MFWVMRQPTCVFVETVHDSRLRRRLRGLRAQRSPVDSPGGPDRAPRGQDHSRFSCTPPHVPPERSVPCRFAWPLPGGRAVILFKANAKSRTTQRKQNASTMHVRNQRATGARARSPRGTCPRTSRSLGGLSFALATRAGPARREQARAPRPATRPRPRALCGATGPHPPPAPRPRDRTASERGCTLSVVRTFHVASVDRAACDCPVPTSVRICSIFSIASILTLAERIQPSATHGPSLPVPKELTHMTNDTAPIETRPRGARARARPQARSVCTVRIRLSPLALRMPIRHHSPCMRCRSPSRLICMGAHCAPCRPCLCTGFMARPSARSTVHLPRSGA